MECFQSERRQGAGLGNACVDNCKKREVIMIAVRMANEAVKMIDITYPHGGPSESLK
jgi:hypothetical protein